MRNTITSLIVALVIFAFTIAAHAQQAGKVYRIGLLHSASSAVPLFTEAFRQGMREQDYIEGKNYVLEIRARKSKSDQLSNMAADLVRLKVDIILTSGYPALLAAKEATTTIPIVMHTGVDPVKRGLVASLAQPGGNLTGVVSIGVRLNAKRFGLLIETVPRAKHVAVLTTSRRVAAKKGRLYEELSAAAQKHGIILQIATARNAIEIDKAFLAMAEAQADALLVMPSPHYLQHRERIIRNAANNRLPAIYFHSAHVESGGLITYGPKYEENFRRMAFYVDKILKGANPGTLPIEQPKRFQLVVNLKTAKALGITIPPSILLQADKVIE